MLSLKQDPLATGWMPLLLPNQKCQISVRKYTQPDTRTSILGYGHQFPFLSEKEFLTMRSVLEFYLVIHHCLLGNRNGSWPVTSLLQITSNIIFYPKHYLLTEINQNCINSSKEGQSRNNSMCDASILFSCETPWPTL